MEHPTCGCFSGVLCAGDSTADPKQQCSATPLASPSRTSTAANNESYWSVKPQVKAARAAHAGSVDFFGRVANTQEPVQPVGGFRVAAPSKSQRPSPPPNLSHRLLGLFQFTLAVFVGLAGGFAGLAMVAGQASIALPRKRRPQPSTSCNMTSATESASAPRSWDTEGRLKLRR